jgi:[ribosomal protein S18]-alanine N-acetyltransferase
MISLHPIQEADSPLVADLVNRAFGRDRYDAARFERHCLRHEVSREDSRIARLDGEAVGYALLGYGEPWGALVTSLGVVPEARRRGVARALLDDVAAAAGRRGHEWLWLEVDEGNAAAMACYEGAGFEVARRGPTWRITMPETPAPSFVANVVFRPIEEPLEMYDWYDALPLAFDDWTFAQYRYGSGRLQAVRATRHGETIAAAYVLHAADTACYLAKFRLAELADWVPEFLHAAAGPGVPLSVTDVTGRYGQWFAAWGYVPGPVRIWMRKPLR